MSKRTTIMSAPSPARILTAILVCAVLFSLSDTTHARQKARNNTTGRIEVSTNPGGYPILIDGQPSGVTSTTVRLIELAPGTHHVEIQFPNNTLWARDITIAANRKQCITLNYHQRSIELPRVEKPPCPYSVNVSAPTSVTEGSIVTFAADVAYSGPSALNYTWTVSPSSARILSGAGTPTITVDSTGLGHQRVTAVLDVDDGSGDRMCRQRASSATSVMAMSPPPAQPKRFDEFPSITFDDDKARLDNLAVELQNEPASTGYVIVYGGRRSGAGSAERLGERTRDYLILTRKIDANRITIINGGLREKNSFELWLVPQGAIPPQPTPTVQHGDVTPLSPRRPHRRG